MKKLLLIFTVYFVCSFNFVYPNGAEKSAAKNETIQNEPQPIDIAPFLIKGENELAEMLKKNPAIFNRQKLKKQTAWNFSVGSTKSWWASNFETQDFYTVNSTCRAVGTHCYIFVADDQWNSKVTQTQVDAVKNAFDNSTPANNSKGIYQTVTEVFGSAPDEDGDSKIIILMMDILDGYQEGTNTGFVAGYFYAINEYPQTELFGTKYKSNEAEIFYMDCYPANLSTNTGLENSLNTTAHEFQHMIHWNYHRSTPQQTFFNEACSETAPYICGYGIRSHSLFTSNTNIALTNWSSDSEDVLKDYARASRFFLYMYEQFGSEFLSKFVQNSGIGISALNSALAGLSTPTSRRFDDILVDWSIANAVNDKSVNSKWGYTAADLSIVEDETVWELNNTNVNVSMMNYASRCLTFKTGSNLSFSINNDVSGIAFKEAKFGSSTSVTDIVPGTLYSEPAFGTDYSTVKIIAVNNNPWGSSFTYNSTGNTTLVNEIDYDAAYTGDYYLQLKAGDRQGVEFDAISGAKLNSIKVMLRKTTPMTCNIYSMGTIASPAGTALTNSFTLTASANGEWVEKDFSSENIYLDNGAFVCVDIPDDVTAAVGNCVLVTLKPGQGYEKSLFYDAGNSSWKYYVDASNTFINRIRLTFKANVNGVEQIIEANPVAYKLEQNYPNPFNPSTKIRFSVLNSEKVELNIFDITGQKVAELVNDFKNPGTYEVVWDGKNMNGNQAASGVYFYTLRTGSFNKTSKMVLIR